MPRYTEESFSSGDQSWVGSRHGEHHCQTGTIDHSAFTKNTHYPNGYLLSGTMLNVADLKQCKPFTGAEGEKLAFLYTDQSMAVAADFAAPIFEHGFIKTNQLPFALPEGFDESAHPAFIFRPGEEVN